MTARDDQPQREGFFGMAALGCGVVLTVAAPVWVMAFVTFDQLFHAYAEQVRLAGEDGVPDALYILTRLPSFVLDSAAMVGATAVMLVVAVLVAFVMSTERVVGLLGAARDRRAAARWRDFAGDSDLPQDAWGSSSDERPAPAPPAERRAD